MCILSTVRGAVCGHSFGTGLCMTQPSREHNCRAETPSANERQQESSSSWMCTSWCTSPLLQPFVESHGRPWVVTWPLLGSYPSRPCDLSTGQGRKAASPAHSFLSLVHSSRLTQLIRTSRTSQGTEVKRHWMSQGAWAA